MIIYEFLPNPIGKDVDGEWIKLFNNAGVATNLSGWQIKDASGKTFSFLSEADQSMVDKQTVINPREYLTLDYKTTKISLNNNGETLFLYDASGNLVDKAEYFGNASEGKSLVRQNDGKFVFAGQTIREDVKVEATQNASAIQNVENLSNSLNKAGFNYTNLLIGFFLALAVSFVFIFISKKTDLLSKSE